MTAPWGGPGSWPLPPSVAAPRTLQWMAWLPRLSAPIPCLGALPGLQRTSGALLLMYLSQWPAWDLSSGHLACTGDQKPQCMEASGPVQLQSCS